ncbi:DUF2357 domain-containing protein [Clostridium gasigenes]|nr:DUF2357 domain-containing protein [Clostridium gasigenes]
MSYLRCHPNALLKKHNGFIKGRESNYAATKVVNKRKVTTVDIYENGFVKYMITNIIRRLKVIENNININSEIPKGKQSVNYRLYHIVLHFSDKWL